MAASRLIIFTSLPDVGGHTTITLGLVRLLREQFAEIVVISKEMPGHGTCALSCKALEEMGATVVRIGQAESLGGLSLQATLRKAAPFGPWHRPAAFVTVGMRHLSPLLAFLLRPEKSLYYHITHEITASTVRMLNLYSSVFSGIAFISPASLADAKAQLSGKRPYHALIQPTELQSPHPIATRRPGPVRFGFIGRLNEGKGSPVLLQFARQTGIEAELHVAGRGEYGPEFEALSKEPPTGSLVKVQYHGSFAASERDGFLRRFFNGIDYLVVPSQDDREGIPTVILEAIQFGVPVVATESGGTKAFRSPELKPDSPEIVRVIGRCEVIPVLTELAGSSPVPESVKCACHAYFRRHFSDAALGKQWRSALGF